MQCAYGGEGSGYAIIAVRGGRDRRYAAEAMSSRQSRGDVDNVPPRGQYKWNLCPWPRSRHPLVSSSLRVDYFDQYPNQEHDFRQHFSNKARKVGNRSPRFRNQRRFDHHESCTIGHLK